MNTIRKSEEFTAVVRPVWHDGKRSFEASFAEFGRAVTAEGSSPAITLKRLYENGEALIEDALTDGDALPEVRPRYPWDSYSGKMTLRMPRSLHYKLHSLAEEEDVSLNALVISILSWGAERKHCEIRPLQAHTTYNWGVTIRLQPFGSAEHAPMIGPQNIEWQTLLHSPMAAYSLNA